MEVLHRYGSPEQKAKWLRPLLAGEIRSAFLMTEPAVASSDATNIETSIVREGDEYVINGRKWWSSGVGDPRCKIAIVMGKTNPSARAARAAVADPRSARHARRSRSSACCRSSATTTRRTATPRSCSRTFACRRSEPAARRRPRIRDRAGPARPGPHPPLHAHDRRCRSGAGENGQAAARRASPSASDLRAFGLGAAHRRSAHRHRDDAPALPQGRRHDGQGRQQGARSSRSP